MSGLNNDNEGNGDNEEFVVTPWEVRGKIDYDMLVERFGTQRVDDSLLGMIESRVGELHLQLRRGIVYSHRDFDLILKKFDEGEKFALYTGRGPSGGVHLGHMLPWFFTKWLQDNFDADLYFQMTDDEKFLFNPDLTLEDTQKFSLDNALDVMAVGLNPKKTFIMIDTRCSRTLYNLGIKFSKHVTFSTAKAVFGFKNSDNIGMIFFPTIQAMPCFLPSLVEGKNIPVLIPASIDQDPYWRVTRDVAPKIGFYKPSQLHGKLLPGLSASGKMSASQPETAIFTKDSPEEARKKIWRAFTGGRVTIEEQRKYGANPDICAVFAYYYFLFEEDDEALKERERRCKTGDLLCGDCKNDLIERIVKFLREHQKKREKMKDILDQVLIDDSFFDSRIKSAAERGFPDG